TRLVRTPGVSLPQPNLNDPNAVAANLYTERGVNFDHTLTARATLLYRPNDMLGVQLNYAHQHTNTDGQNIASLPLLATGQFASATRIVASANRMADLTSLVVSAHFGFAELVSASSYSFRHIFQPLDTTDTYLSTNFATFPAFVAIDDHQLNRNNLRRHVLSPLVGSGHCGA